MNTGNGIRHHVFRELYHDVYSRTYDLILPTQLTGLLYLSVHSVTAWQTATATHDKTTQLTERL